MNPHVTAILLTADRQAFTDRAVKCFLAQTYENKSLLVYDNPAVKGYMPSDVCFSGKPMSLWCRGFSNPALPRPTIGASRNAANRLAAQDFPSTKVLMHWDSDEWCAPTRMEEQVRYLIDSKADVVGYNECLFWKVPERLTDRYETYGEAWRYRSTHPHDILGTSLCYWREVWERRPFADTSQGEDERFVRGLNCAAQSAIPGHPGRSLSQMDFERKASWTYPLMVATIHGANTSKAYQEVGQHPQHWTREAQWDSRLREIMEL